jgi:hypothetical protein
MKERSNTKENFNNSRKGKGNPSIAPIEKHNEKPYHSKYSDELKKVSQYKKKINSSFMMKNYEDEIRYRKHWQAIELLIALIIMAPIIIIFVYILIHLLFSKEIPVLKQIQLNSPSLIWISVIFLISSFAFFFLKLFRKGFTDIQNTRRELENFLIKAILLQNALDEEDKAERSKMLIEYSKADNKIFSSPSQSTPETFCKDVEENESNPLQYIRKIFENMIPLRPNPQ